MMACDLLTLKGENLSSIQENTVLVPFGMILMSKQKQLSQIFQSSTIKNEQSSLTNHEYTSNRYGPVTTHLHKKFTYNQAHQSHIL
jgi:hypothetical protein